MVRKRSKRDKSSLNHACQKMTLREENLGKRHVNMSSRLKTEHLQNIATWASGEPKVPGLAALFGRHLASTIEASGICLDRSPVFCQRCETVLLPGNNCTIRIERNAAKVRRHGKKASPSQNALIYTCHFCLHRNSRRGTSRGHIKELLASRASSMPASTPSHAPEPKSPSLKEDPTIETENVHVNTGRESAVRSREISEARSDGTAKGTTKDTMSGKHTPVTPIGASLKKEGMQDTSGTTKPAASSDQNTTTKEASNCTSRSRKRRRKKWSSLKNIVESSEQASKDNISSLVIPFKL